MLKNLPLGIQDFEDLRANNYVYVDKTKLIYNLIKTPRGFYFLSRPRRFGKSLLISTLDCLFEGKKDLFKGLWLYENTDWSWEKHPVITIDFNRIDHATPELLRKEILKTINTLADSFHIQVTYNSIPMNFATLILELKKKYSKNVVVLIDEYDRSIVNHLGKGEEELRIADKNRDVLRLLFGVLKAQDVSGALRFIFITGVTKFSQVSVFSALNNLEDLTMRKDYCDLAGYSERELYHYFKNYIQDLSSEFSFDIDECKHRLRLWYNGYQFTEEHVKVYNPFSILSLFKAKQFKNYWFETGTPSFLVNLIKEREYNVPDIEYLQLDEQTFSTFDIDHMKVEALLFQTGYITITGYEDYIYELSYPNQEVKKSFLNYILNFIVNTSDLDIKSNFLLLNKYLKDYCLEDFIETVNTILASIPYSQIAGKDESYYHTVFYLMLSASGVEVLTEVLTSRGRIDIAVLFADKTYVIELKCNQAADQALKQIKLKDYAGKYRDRAKRVILMGINFDTEKRVIAGWKVEEHL